VPQRAVLARSALAVTHAGFNTVMDALSFGVPMLGLPITFEQPATGARLERAGAAVVLQRRRTKARIGAALRTLLDGGEFRASAGRLAEEIAERAGSAARRTWWKQPCLRGGLPLERAAIPAEFFCLTITPLWVERGRSLG
jgi:UDP:flavonoid glycosyltransferase YjiC (YdhE family)